MVRWYWIKLTTWMCERSWITCANCKVICDQPCCEGRR